MTSLILKYLLQIQNNLLILYYNAYDGKHNYHKNSLTSLTKREIHC